MLGTWSEMGMQDRVGVVGKRQNRDCRKTERLG